MNRLPKCYDGTVNVELSWPEKPSEFAELVWNPSYTLTRHKDGKVSVEIASESYPLFLSNATRALVVRGDFDDFRRNAVNRLESGKTHALRCVHFDAKAGTCQKAIAFVGPGWAVANTSKYEQVERRERQRKEFQKAWITREILQLEGSLLKARQDLRKAHMSLQQMIQPILPVVNELFCRASEMHATVRTNGSAFEVCQSHFKALEAARAAWHDALLQNDGYPEKHTRKAFDYCNEVYRASEYAKETETSWLRLSANHSKIEPVLRHCNIAANAIGEKDRMLAEMASWRGALPRSMAANQSARS